ncbi:hypothetical protein PISMIDRAFT_210526 [Pisolithus microcarpus 441]|uniref:Uncharacterized protein n=1 Tax=Pisolithus microcarpus 441 TaxID=765257 RepID=A0A0C9XZM6_9AGAM|nr:hypothetical protein PISMIDRAFT_210526 [Pisolithus microcarpus 441]
MLIRRVAGHQSKLRNSTNSSLNDLKARFSPHSLLLLSTECFRPLFKVQVLWLNSCAKRSTVAHSTDIRIFSPNAKRQQEDPTPDTQDTKQPKRDDSHEHSNAGHQ